MALEIAQKIWNAFRGGRYTRNNLANVSDDHVLIASDVIFPGDGIAHKRPGYTLVKASPFATVKRIFDFQRQSDAAQLVLLAGGGKLGWMPPDGSAYTQISAAEDANAIFDFATNVFGCYCTNGKASYRLVDQAGVLRKWKWGIDAPVAAPTVAIGAGALTLEAGRQYAYSYVSKWTDSQGVTRVHVGPPSPLSAHSGPVTLKVITVGALAASTDPQVSHIWIWATNDTPEATTSTLFFAAEVTNGTTSWGDTLADIALDETRLAPYDNNPAPLATVLLEYQQRIVAAGIPGKPDLVMATGLAETPLGIPQESWPLKMFFNVPGGIKAVNAGCVYNEALMLSTPEYWFQIRGLTADTFTEKDKIFGPGAAGPRCVTVFGSWMAWLGVDKKIWAWDGANAPIEVSWKIARADGSGQLSMENLSDAVLAKAELRSYSFGRYNVLALFASTTAHTTYFDWVQIYDVSALSAPSGPYGEMTKDGRLTRGSESDAFLAHAMVATGNVLVGNTPYIFVADNAGNVYRWPDGWTDAGTTYQPMMGSEFSDLDEPEVLKRMRWLDLKTSRQDALTAFVIRAAATDGVYADTTPVAVLNRALPNQVGADASCVRGLLEQQKGTSFGRMLRWWITFPKDNQDCELYSAIAKFTAVNTR